MCELLGFSGLGLCLSLFPRASTIPALTFQVPTTQGTRAPRALSFVGTGRVRAGVASIS